MLFICSADDNPWHFYAYVAFALVVSSVDNVGSCTLECCYLVACLLGLLPSLNLCSGMHWIVASRQSTMRWHERSVPATCRCTRGGAQGTTMLCTRRERRGRTSLWRRRTRRSSRDAVCTPEHHRVVWKLSCKSSNRCCIHSWQTPTRGSVVPAMDWSNKTSGVDPAGMHTLLSPVFPTENAQSINSKMKQQAMPAIWSDITFKCTENGKEYYLPFQH